MDTMEKIMQEIMQDRDKQENGYHKLFQQLEDLIQGLTIVVEKIPCKEKSTKNVLALNGGRGQRGGRAKQDIQFFIKMEEIGYSSVRWRRGLWVH